MSAVVTQTFRDALRQAHRRVVKVEVLDSQNRLLTEIPVSAGQVAIDLSAGSGLRTGRLTVASPEYVPVNENSPLAPFGQHRIRPSIGIAMTTGTQWCSLGLYLVTEVQNQRPFGGLEVTLTDLAFMAQQLQLDSPYTPPANVSAAAEIKRLLDQCYGSPLTVVRDDSNGRTIGTYVEVLQPGATWWEMATGIANKVGCDLYFDDDGGIVLHDADAATAPVETVDVGPGGVVVGMDSAVSRLGVLNEVIVIHEGQNDQTVRAVARITTGPLRRGGPFGIAREVSIENVENVSQAAAQASADRLLARKSALVRRLSLTTAPMPHLRPGDTIAVVFPNGATEHARIQAIEHSLVASGATKIETRWDPTAPIGPMAVGPRVLQDGGFLAGDA